MEDHYCEFLELEIRLPVEQFDKEAFLNDVQTAFDEKKGTHMWAFGSIEKPEKQHAHLRVDFRREKHVRFTITYHNFAIDAKDIRPPYMEDCVQWLGKFFKEELVPTDLVAAFRFDDKYAPIISLPFPLLAASKQLVGSEVTGVSIKLPIAMKTRRAIIQRDKDDTVVQIETRWKMKIREFDLKKKLEHLSLTVMMLVNPVGESK